MKLNTPGATKLLGTLALLLLAGAGWLLVLQPKTDELAAVEEQITNAREQNLLLAQQLRTLTEQAENLDVTRAEAAYLRQKFPPTADQPRLFREVTAAATDAGIPPTDVTALTPTPPSTGVPAAGGAVELTAADDAGLAEQTVTVSVTGSYPETQELLERLESMDRAYLVDSVTVGAGTDENSFTTTVTGKMFLMPPVADPGPDFP